MGKIVLKSLSVMLHQMARHGPVHRSLAPPWHRYALHAMAFGAGLGQPTDDHYDYDGLKRGQSEWALLQYTLAGQGRLRYQQQTLAIHPGQAMLLTLPHDHRYWKAPEHDWSFFYLCLQGSEVVRAWQQVIAQLGPVVDLGPRSRPCRQAWQLCMQVIEHDALSPWDVSTATYQLAMSLLAMAEAPEAGGRQRSVRQRPAGIRRALEHLRQSHDLCAMDVGRLARVAGMSRHHFSRCFHASEGMSPGQYLTRFKLRKAVMQLQHTDTPIKQLAVDCGYRDANYFAKAFGKAYGLSPSDYRARLTG